MFKPGDTVDRYTVDSILGQGGMGTVYRARDARLERRVAIKVIAEAAGSEATGARLLREARAAAAFDHPNAVSIFDVGAIDGAPFIVMELVNGRTLREVMSGTRAPIAVRIGWLTDVARALSAAHKRGLVHRDIKPENVMVRDDGVVKVLDFGIARRSQEEVDPSAPTQATALPTLTKEGVKIGTPLYMAPEQIRSEKLDGRVDQFAWGVVAYELLTGKLPWRGAADPLAVAASILTDKPDEAALDAAGAPAPMKAAILRALSKSPDDRFASMDDLARALDPAAKDEAPEGPRARISAAPAGAAAPASAVTQMQKYSTDDVRAVLARAIERQEEASSDSRLAFDDLLAAAREVGVGEEALREASRELRAQAEATSEGRDYEVWRRRKRRKFFRHLGIYLIVNAALIIFGFFTDSLEGLAQPALWWGIGVGIHALRALTAHEDEFHEERAREAQKAGKRRARKEAVERAIEEGATALLSTGEALRRRARVAPVEDRRVRVATGGGRAAEAEREAEMEMEASAGDQQSARRR